MTTPREFEDHRRLLARELKLAEEHELLLMNDTPINTSALRDAVAARDEATRRYERWVTVGETR
jgi:hypothetical protein